MKPDFSKSGGLIPAIIQDADTAQVLMLGYMNEAALQQTRDTGWVTFFSRSRNSLWVKGATSGNRLRMVAICADCDGDTFLVKARPAGPVCHTGQYSCFGAAEPKGFLYRLQALIRERLELAPETSYTSRLAARGINKVAQKVGEEAVELVIEAMDNDRDLFINEAADLLYHLLLLLQVKNVSLKEVEAELMRRNEQKSRP
ncbi:MAG: bifunctional phosphoribosyl-AMP cyclohydrolase/phosphoribosyl-ATP diphosphatase HisIE [Chitinophagaceae bacterium]